MAATRLPMRRLRELLRLKYDAGLSHRAIAQACAMGLGTVTAYLQRAAAAGVTWPLPEDLDDGALEARLFARPALPLAGDRVVPAWAELHQELKQPGVTLALLWTEYRAQHPTGLRLQPVLRAVPPLGTRAEAVDAPGASGRARNCLSISPASGRTWSIPPTGELVVVELFVGVLGASGLDLRRSDAAVRICRRGSARTSRMLDAFQGSAAIWVPDNLKSGVTTAHRYEPEINRTYAELAQHYGAVVIPARVAHAHRQAQGRGERPNRPALGRGRVCGIRPSSRSRTSMGRSARGSPRSTRGR